MLLQATSGQETSAAPTSSSEGLLNLLLLADSSLQDCDSDPSNVMSNQPEAVSEHRTDDAMHRGTEDIATTSMSLYNAEDQPSTSDAGQQRPMSAGTLAASFSGCRQCTTCCCDTLVLFAPAFVVWKNIASSGT